MCVFVKKKKIIFQRSSNDPYFTIVRRDSRLLRRSRVWRGESASCRDKKPELARSLTARCYRATLLLAINATLPDSLVDFGESEFLTRLHSREAKYSASSDRGSYISFDRTIIGTTKVVETTDL